MTSEMIKEIELARVNERIYDTVKLMLSKGLSKAKIESIAPGSIFIYETCGGA